MLNFFSFFIYIIRQIPSKKKPITLYRNYTTTSQVLLLLLLLLLLLALFYTSFFFFVRLLFFFPSCFTSIHTFTHTPHHYFFCTYCFNFFLHSYTHTETHIMFLCISAIIYVQKIKCRSFFYYIYYIMCNLHEF